MSHFLDNLKVKSQNAKVEIQKLQSVFSFKFLL